MYTCLSRGSSLEGTAIVQGFDCTRITGGLSGYLRQEFRELELLDEITRLRYEDSLSAAVQGNTRGFLIHAYRTWKGESYVPLTMPNPLKWSPEAPLTKDDPIEEAEWQIIGTQSNKSAASQDENGSSLQHKEKSQVTKPVTKVAKISRFVPAKGSQPLEKLSKEQGTNKRQRSDEENLPTAVKKNRRMPEIENMINTSGPEGLIWDRDSSSCAYDSLFTILKAFYVSLKTEARESLHPTNEFMLELCGQFDQVILGNRTLEEARDNMRIKLYATNPNLFPIRGTAGTAVDQLCNIMFNSEPNSQWITSCVRCKSVQQEDRPEIAMWQIHKDSWMSSASRAGSYKTATVTNWIRALCCQKNDAVCRACKDKTVRQLVLMKPPAFLMIAAAPAQKIKVAWEQFIKVDDTEYQLCGLIYLAKWHYTARIITEDGNIWYHDGIKTQKVCAAESNMKITPGQDLNKLQNGCYCHFGIYAKVH